MVYKLLANPSAAQLSKDSPPFPAANVKMLPLLFRPCVTNRLITRSEHEQ